MAKNEDKIQRSCRITRDRLFRQYGYNPNSVEYKAALDALQLLRTEYRHSSSKATV